MRGERPALTPPVLLAMGVAAASIGAGLLLAAADAAPALHALIATVGGLLVAAAAAGPGGVLWYRRRVTLAGFDALPLPAVPRHVGRRAGRGWRLLAWLVDAMAAFGIGFFLVAIAVSIYEGVHHTSPDNSTSNAIVWACFAAAILTYVPLSWRRGATLGMRLCRLRLVDARTGARPRWAQVLLRFLVVLPAIAVVVPVGIILGGDDPWRDRVSGTAVVHR